MSNVVAVSSRKHLLRSSDMICWRVAAIYRSCVHYGKEKSWAISKMRELFPNGSRDSLIENWWYDMPSLQARHAAKRSLVENSIALAA